MLEKLHLRPGMQILEIGCGNAAFWKSTASLIPEKLEIHLTDYSEGLSGNSEIIKEREHLFLQPDWKRAQPGASSTHKAILSKEKDSIRIL